MVKISSSEFPILIEAVLVWTGWGSSAFPRRDDASLLEHFGAEPASMLRPILKSLEEEFYSSDPWRTAANLQEMGESAAEHFKTRLPEIPDQIVRAFTWCYTYDYK